MQKSVQHPLFSFKHIWRNIRQIIISLLILALGGLLYWLMPMPATEPSLSAMKNSAHVIVTESNDLIRFQPMSPAKTGFIFYPGALVDPRAYAQYMHRYADAGYETFIVKMPYNFAFAGGDRAEDIIKAYPQIQRWAIGGHSLGGVSASQFAAGHREIKGIIYDGSYPAGNQVQQLNGKEVASIYGSNDGLTHPADVQKSRSNLPPQTKYVEIQGSIHSFFGDYGHQPGDGEPTISRAQAQQQIINATLDFLHNLPD